jgi:hypothetical protein
VIYDLDNQLVVNNLGKTNGSLHPGKRKLLPIRGHKLCNSFPVTPCDVGDLLPLLHGHYPASFDHVMCGSER